MRLLIQSIVTLVAAASVLSAAGLQEVLAAMDRAAASFSDVTATVEKTNFTKIIDDTETETGEVWMSRRNGLRMRIEFGGDNRRSVALAGRKAEMYYPKANLVNEYDLGDIRDTVEQFLLLGFGTSGKELTKDYQAKVTGEEEINGIAASRLELVPKNRKAREQLTRAELWVADEGGYPVQQKFYWPDGNTATFSYSEIEINPGLSGDDLALDLPADVKREFPQK